MMATERFTKAQHTFLPISHLETHPLVQRRFRPEWGRELRDNFDPDKFGELAVVKDGDKYLIFDGQHRRWAAAECLGPNQKVPCIVYAEMAIERQAELFIGRNTTKGVRATDKFKISVIAGKSAETEITKILAAMNLRIEDARTAGTVRSPAALLKVYGRYGGPILTRTLQVIDEAWGRDVDAYDGLIIRAIGSLIHRFSTSIDDVDFGRKLGRNGGPSRMLGQARDVAKAMGAQVERAAIDRMLNVYNKGRRTNVLSLNRDID